MGKNRQIMVTIYRKRAKKREKSTKCKNYKNNKKLQKTGTD